MRNEHAYQRSTAPAATTRAVRSTGTVNATYTARAKDVPMATSRATRVALR